MWSRAIRVRALVAGFVAVLVVAVTSVSAAGAAGSGAAHTRLLARCARAISGEASGGARAVPGSADPQVAAELSIFRAARTSRDALPAASNLGHALGGAEAATYDPSGAVRLHLGGARAAPLYAVPATLAAPSLPARCAHLPGLAGVRGLLAIRTLETGTGPGVCVVAVTPATPVSVLPGKSKKAPSGQASAGCESLTVMSSYLGAFGAGLTAGVGTSAVLLPDGISSVTYTLAGGRQATAPVTGNLSSVPSAILGSPRLGEVTRAKLRRLFEARLPVTITESNADGTAVATLTRPADLIGALVREALLLKRLFTAGTTSEEGAYASCSARTHRCVAAVVTTTCDAHHQCTIRRRLDRYRYTGRRPPRGTIARADVPTAPIRARLNRYVTHPGKLSLELTGAPHHRVDVLHSVNCFTRHGEGSSGMGGSPLRVAIPSRTSIATVRPHRACDVNVLVTSAGRGPVHARLVRG